MDVSEEDLIGEPLDQVPVQDSTDESCMGRRWERRDGEKVFVGYCGAWPGKGTDDVGEGRCSKHGGAGGAPEDNDNAEGNDGGAPEDNDNAADHGAYSEKFLEGFVGPDGKDRIKEGFELSKTSEGAQDQARLMAQVAAEKFRLTGDERFLRRYESICDKAGIFPNEELDVNHNGIEDAFMGNLKDYHEDDDVDE
jgi:hypothetical protein